MMCENHTTEASFAFASDRSLKVCYDRSLANAKLASVQGLLRHILFEFLRPRFLQNRLHSGGFSLNRSAPFVNLRKVYSLFTLMSKWKSPPPLRLLLQLLSGAHRPPQILQREVE